MPEDKNKKTVDIDTSGPEVDVEFEDTTKPEPEFEVKESNVKEVEKEEKPLAASSEKLDTSDEKQEVKTEVKKDELEDYSESVQRRIAKLTKKMREAERQREEALTYAQSVKAEKEALTKKFSTLENVSLKDREAKIVSALEAAKSKLLVAREANDVGAEIEVQKEIARLGYEDGRLQELKSASENLAKEEPKRIADVRIPERQQTTADPKAEAWASKNKWFGSDKAMTYTAFDIHKTLIDEEGYDAQTEEYYAEIDKRIRLEFPHKFDKNATTESTKPVQTVASAKRSTKPGRKTVRLTPSHVAIAKKLGVPLEEYAKQLNITKEV
jgi:DNA polymerase III alpha subunit